MPLTAQQIAEMDSITGMEPTRTPERKPSFLGRFAKGALRGGPTGLFQEFGGEKVTKAVLPRTMEYVTKTVPEYYKKGLPRSYKEQLKETARIAPKGAGAGAELYGAYGLAKSLPSLFKTGKKVLRPKQLLSKKRVTKATALGKKKVLSKSKLLKAGDAYVKDDPLAKNIWEKLRPSIKKMTGTGEEYLRKKKIWGKAYTQAGRAAKSAKAGVYDVLLRAAKKEIAKKAPGIAKSTAQLRLLYQGPKTAGKTLRTLGKIGAAATGVGALKYLTGRR